VTFVARSAAAAVGRRSAAGRELIPIGPTRGLTRSDLWLNRAAPAIEIDPVDGCVTLDDRRLAVDPVDEVPLSRRYFLR
jgi:urease subunit alpha